MKDDLLSLYTAGRIASVLASFYVKSEQTNSHDAKTVHTVHLSSVTTA